MPPIDLPEILEVPLPTEDVPDSTIHLDRHTAEDEALLLLRDFINELETILASKATPAQITTAVSALADSTSAALAGKASDADLTALATTVGGKATPADITTAVNALATSISGSYATVLLYSGSGSAFPARPAGVPAGLVLYKGGPSSTPPTDWLAGDDWSPSS